MPGAWREGGRVKDQLETPGQDLQSLAVNVKFGSPSKCNQQTSRF